MKIYGRVQLIAGINLIAYLAALYFSTGVHTGFKLDDNQLIGYMACGILLILLGISLVVKTMAKRKMLVLLLFMGCLTLLLLTIFNIVSFNEAFWYFMPFVYGIPFAELGETIEFLLCVTLGHTKERYEEVE